jgi:serine/threonine protein kinase
MSDVWKRWEGQLADSKFPLHHFLAATNHSAVFLTQLSDRTPRQAAIKFISADDPAAGQQLAVWNQVAQLSHPNLLRLFQWGRCRLDGMNLLYVVMECAEENLAQVLPQRALTSEETRDMLNPVVDVLVYLHAKFLVHSHIKPSNLLAIGDLLKLSSDTIFPITQPREALREPDIYDAPEAASSPAKLFTPASDVWSLGVTLVEALTQSAPGLPFDNAAEPIFPNTLPQPFLDVVRQSLHREPKRRWSAPQIAARLSGIAQPVVAAAPAAASATVASASAAAAGGGSSLSATSVPISPLSVPLSREPAMPLSKLPAAPAPRLPNPKSRAAQPSPPSSDPSQGLSNFLIPALLGAFILVVGVLAVPRFFRFRPEPVTARPSPSSAAQPASAVSSPSQPAASLKSVPASPAGIDSPKPNSLGVSPPPKKPVDPLTAENAPVSESRHSRDATASLAVLRSESPSSAASAKPATSNPARGEVLDQVLPAAPEKALATIHGTFHITARVQVDPSGSVTDVTLDDPGPSKYFANLTEQAARRWEFSTPESNGHAIPSEWLLRFEFSSSGIHAFPTQNKP